MLVSTKTDASLAELVREYDKRSGAPESKIQSGLSSPLNAKVSKIGGRGTTSIGVACAVGA